MRFVCIPILGLSFILLSVPAWANETGDNELAKSNPIVVSAGASFDTDKDLHPLLITGTKKVLGSLAFGGYIGWEQDSKLCDEERFPGHFAGLWESHKISECDGDTLRGGIQLSIQADSSAQNWFFQTGLRAGWQKTEATYIKTSYFGSDLHNEISTHVTDELTINRNFEFSIFGSYVYRLHNSVYVGPIAEVTYRNDVYTNIQASLGLSVAYAID